MNYVRAKKSLGQNFLTSASHVRAVADAGAVGKGDVVLEVGPGRGILTHELLSRGARVIAVEKDGRLIETLEETFANEIRMRHLTLIHGDILDTDTASIVPAKRAAYKAVANIPYYITGAFLRVLLSGKRQPSRAALLVQKEVAQRIARSAKESLLSLSVKAYGTPRYVRTVPRGAFAPAPSVDSAILSIEGISRSHFENTGHERRFFELLRSGFAQKRKYLARNLERAAKREDIERAFLELSLKANARAEDVALRQWLSLAKKLRAPDVLET